MRTNTSEPQALQDLSILLIYRGEDAGTWSLCHLARGEGVIAPDELEPERFAEAQGGIRIFHQRIYCFLDTDAAGDLISYAYFLLGSLVALAAGPLDPDLAALRPDAEFMGLSDVRGSLMGLDRSMLVLRAHGDQLVLDYLDDLGQAPETRGSPYFRAVPVAPEAWRRAAAVALDEYIAVVAHIREVSDTDDDARIARLWERARSTLAG